MREPRAELDDLYNQNESIIGLLERLNENIYLIREAVYGQTRRESNQPYENPKHGHWGMVSADQIASIESTLEDIAEDLSNSRSRNRRG
ncbi:hypothetical protein [Nesterenkonia natronophila]|uniref:Uncharacterized protein n=1 Tax=Nesterenkonia natronophila TaxID=2174932 RepID=A0A3A4FCU9_9MICC|nr:hypothetical protein [Nesterenkonia natronophila]RJN32907.1 hypothetical protein D3250_03585 [Nesterenkonia natronophila]